ncbi:hypothetical protein BOX37_00795 [Nocardia mangyaensis]|uniref:PPE domain-containing protein n=1 Tax=Nocardia mangyaensis TaxID=2213200 RepID=A0A1J0VL59_9NOCA|nr:hypothetical protein [Nocardia mangyaensis]APE32750.1 hypothetical protein BOX37_00795 [Nocardia mangyaensis]
MPLPLIAAAVVAVGAVAAEGKAIYDNQKAAHDDATARGELGIAANDAVSGDREIIESERGRLESGFDGTYAQAVLTGKLEGFSSLSHQAIWDALNGTGGQPGVLAAEINAGADGWRRLVSGMSDAVTSFRTKIDTAINDGWDGAAANAAIDGVRGYATEAEKLPTTFQMVANGIDLMEGALQQAKMAIDEPKDVSWDEKLLGAIPFTDWLKGEQFRADEAERAAQEILERVYKPQAEITDTKTPVLAVPKNTIGGDGLPSDGRGPFTGGGGTTGGSNGSTGGGDQGTPQTTTPQTTAENPDGNSGDNAPGEDTDPAATTPAATTPDTGQTTPAATTPGATGTGTPGGGIPGSGGAPGGGGGTAGSGSPGLGAGAHAPGAGRGLPGSPSTGTPAAAAAGRAGGAAGRGMSGMPGMMGGGGRGGGKDDESEHKIPDYLIQDRESELIGQLPPTLPPGGVIGE